MEKCACEKAKDEIDEAWYHPKGDYEGNRGSGCKRLRDIMDADVHYAKACEWCPCRKRQRTELVLPLSVERSDVSVEPASESSRSHFLPSASAERMNEKEGPCQCMLRDCRDGCSP